MISLENLKMYLQYARKTVYLRFLKRFKNLDFTGRIENEDKRFNGYEGCYPVKKILRKLKITKNDSVLDIGCGKGLFLYYASEFDFNKIDGLEYSDEYAETARKNASILKDGRIHVFKADARNFDKYDEYNFFFLNNPFDAETTESVVKKITQSLETQKRKIKIIYQFPFKRKIFEKYGFKAVYEKFPNMLLEIES